MEKNDAKYWELSVTRYRNNRNRKLQKNKLKAM
jgi:hypothetical protein